MEVKEKQQASDSTPKVVAPPVEKSSPCSKQIQEYANCLDSFSGIFTSCRTEQNAFKSCSEFDTWLKTTVKKKNIQ